MTSMQCRLGPKADIATHAPARGRPSPWTARTDPGRYSVAAQRWRLPSRTRIETGSRGLMTTPGRPTLTRAITIPVQDRADYQRRRKCRANQETGQWHRRDPFDRQRRNQPKRGRYQRKIDFGKPQIIAKPGTDNRWRGRCCDHVNGQFFRRQMIEHHRPQQPQGCKHYRDVDRVPHALTSQGCNRS